MWENIKILKQKEEDIIKNYLVSEPNYHTTKFFTENLLVIEMKKTQMIMNKCAYFGLSILALSKMLINEFWYEYLKPRYGEKANFCYIDTDSFIIYIKTDDIYHDIVEDVKTRFHTSNMN